MVKSKVEDKDLLLDENTIRKCRIIADHLRCACFIIGDEISTIPSNKGRGYVLRKIIRRAINYADQLRIEFDSYEFLINMILDMYKETNPSLNIKRNYIIDVIHTEYDLYKTTLRNNIVKIENELKDKEFITNEELETLFDRYGVPVDIIKEKVINKKELVRNRK